MNGCESTAVDMHLGFSRYLNTGITCCPMNYTANPEPSLQFKKRFKIHITRNSYYFKNTDFMVPIK